MARPATTKIMAGLVAIVVGALLFMLIFHRQFNFLIGKLKIPGRVEPQQAPTPPTPPPPPPPSDSKPKNTLNISLFWHQHRGLLILHAKVDLTRHKIIPRSPLGAVGTDNPNSLVYLPQANLLAWCDAKSHLPYIHDLNGSAAPERVSSNPFFPVFFQIRSRGIHAWGITDDNWQSIELPEIKAPHPSLQTPGWSYHPFPHPRKHLQIIFLSDRQIRWKFGDKTSRTFPLPGTIPPKVFAQILARQGKGWQANIRFLSPQQIVLVQKAPGRHLAGTRPRLIACGEWNSDRWYLREETDLPPQRLFFQWPWLIRCDRRGAELEITVTHCRKNVGNGFQVQGEFIGVKGDGLFYWAPQTGLWRLPLSHAGEANHLAPPPPNLPRTLPLFSILR